MFSVGPIFCHILRWYPLTLELGELAISYDALELVFLRQHEYNWYVAVVLIDHLEQFPISFVHKARLRDVKAVPVKCQCAAVAHGRKTDVPNHMQAFFQFLVLESFNQEVVNLLNLILIVIGLVQSWLKATRIMDDDMFLFVVCKWGIDVVFAVMTV